MPETSRPLSSQIETILHEARERFDHSSFRTDLFKQGGRRFLLACKDTQLSKEAHKLCQEQQAAWLQEIAWEKLHTGNWKDVCQVWRDAYTLACLLVAAGNMRSAWQRGGANPVALLKTAITGSLRELDMAVIMGGPLFRPQADAFISLLQQAWEAEGERHSPQPPTEEPQQKRRKVQAIKGDHGEEAVQLPPGSLENPERLVVREAAPSLERFWTRYMNPAEGPAPVVITGAIKHWPARQRWQDLAYLKRVAGARTVPVEIGSHYLAEGWGQQLMPLADFIDRYVLGNRTEAGQRPEAAQPGIRQPERRLDGGAERRPESREGSEGGLSGAQAESSQREGGLAELAACLESVECCTESQRTVHTDGRSAASRASLRHHGDESACQSDDRVECGLRPEEQPGGELEGAWLAAEGMSAQEGGSRCPTADSGMVSETTESCAGAHGRKASSSASPGKMSDGGTELPAGAPERGYLAQHPLFEQIPALKRDIEEPLYCCLGEGEVQSVNAWFGPPGTVTPLHHDPHHNLLAQVVGRKYIRLYTPAATASLAPYTHGQNTNSSQVDLEAPDCIQFPGLRGLEFVECVLNPGEMLYIAPGWWHFVKSLDVSCSVTFWWR